MRKAKRKEKERRETKRKKSGEERKKKRKERVIGGKSDLTRQVGPINECLITKMPSKIENT